jgi:hypothetical protein
MPTPHQNRQIDLALDRFLSSTSCRRSKAYRAGARSCFKLRVSGYTAGNPYPPGTAKFDAFRSGFADAGYVKCLLLP